MNINTNRSNYIKFYKLIHGKVSGNVLSAFTKCIARESTKSI